MMPVVGVTGASGFVGRHLVQALAREGFVPRQFVRVAVGADEDAIGIGDIGSMKAWDRVLEDVDVVVHLAARVHIRAERDRELFRRTNTQATLSLARGCAAAGVRRLIFISTIGVHGRANHSGPITEESTIRPYSAYTESKWTAERSLRKFAAETDVEVVVLRPPLIYGPQAPGNLATLVRAIKKGLPLPLGGIRNQRSFLFVGNLVEAILACVDAPGAAGESFVVADDDVVSTPELVKLLGRAIGREPRMFSCPPALLRAVSQGIGMRDRFDQVGGSLVVCCRKLKEVTGWSPRVGTADGIMRSYGSGC